MRIVQNRKHDQACFWIHPYMIKQGPKQNSKTQVQYVYARRCICTTAASLDICCCGLFFLVSEMLSLTVPNTNQDSVQVSVAPSIHPSLGVCQAFAGCTSGSEVGSGSVSIRVCLSALGAYLYVYIPLRTRSEGGGLARRRWTDLPSSMKPAARDAGTPMPAPPIARVEGGWWCVTATKGGPATGKQVGVPAKTGGLVAGRPISLQDPRVQSSDCQVLDRSCQHDMR